MKNKIVCYSVEIITRKWEFVIGFLVIAKEGDLLTCATKAANEMKKRGHKQEDCRVFYSIRKEN